MGRCALSFVLLTALAALTIARAEMSPEFRAFQAQYRCAVVDRLARIYAHGNPAVDYSRFIAIAVPEHPHGYVQCLFHDNERRILCEASSGYYLNKLDEPRFYQSAATIGALARLGFSTDDSDGNFQIDLPVAEPPDFNKIADFMLRALHDGYGARAESKLRFEAPFAPRPSRQCIPVS